MMAGPCYGRRYRYKRFALFSYVAATFTPNKGSSFAPLPTSSSWHASSSRNHARHHRPGILGAPPCGGPRRYDHYMSSSPENDESRTNVDAMRSMLESSWNVGSMGAVPTSPESAAEAASESIGSALKRGKGVLLVDLRLPAFDITQGFNIYDEVLAIEFCTALAHSLQSRQLARKALILVKDGSIVRSASRILEAKERQRMEAEAEIEASIRVEEDNNEDDDEEDDEGDETEQPEENSAARTDADIDAFRKQLISGWDESSDSTTESEDSDSSKQQTPPPESRTRRPARFRKKKKPTVNFQPFASSSSDVYRLGSLFGDERIASGADMFTEAVEAVDTHGSMDASEDALIILSPVSREETVAVRRLVARYGNRKTIVLVNCRLDPEPKELFTAEPVYSISPLIAKATKSENNILGREVDTESAPTKIVLLRRFPNDWEIFLDVDGSGFELVDSAPAATVGKDGPGNEWIAGCVKKHMQFKFGQF